MEKLFDFVLTAKEQPSIFYDCCEEVENAMVVLSGYYGSEVWKQDFADDEAGLLPEDLKRGVLSEDGLWNRTTRPKNPKAHSGFWPTRHSV